MSQLLDHSRRVLARDFLIFQLKLALDGLKDVFIFQLSILAVIADFVLGRDRRNSFFYGLIRKTERFDLWLNLYGATERVAESEDGLFGASEAGSDTLLGELEELIREKAGRRGGATA